jgi:hypothetical protein
MITKPTALKKVSEDRLLKQLPLKERRRQRYLRELIQSELRLGP